MNIFGLILDEVQLTTWDKIVNFLSASVPKLITTGITIVVTVILLIIASVIVKKISKTKKSRVITLVKLIHSIVKFVLVVIAIIVILGAWGINVMPVLAGAGILGLVVGLGAQDLIKDFLAGIGIIFEDYYEIGDVVEIDGFKGTISEIGLRSTILVNWLGETKIIRNNQISSAINFSKNPSTGYVDIDVSYDTDLTKAINLLNDHLQKLKEEFPQIIEGPNVIGVTEFKDSAITIRITVMTNANEQKPVERAIRKFVKELFDKNNITIPYPQVVVHHDNSSN